MSFVSATIQEGGAAWQSFLDVDQDVKPWLQIDPGSVDDARDNKLSLMTDMACSWTQNYLQRPVAPTRLFRRFDGWAGWNGAHIMLPYYPVLQVNKVVEYWGLSGPHTLAEQTPEDQGNSDVYQIEPMTGRLTRTFMGLVQRPFFPGSRNVEVDWVAGFNPLPADIRVAALEVAAHWYRNTQETPRWFGRSEEYDQPGASALWPAIPNRITMLLEPYATRVIA